MSKNSWTTRIELPKDKVWELLSNNYADIYKMHPGVEKSTQVEGTPTLGTGQERVCNMYSGDWAQERITTHQEGNLLSIAVIDSSLPVEKFTAEWILTKVTENSTDVTTTIDITGKGFFKLMSPLMARKIKKFITKVLRGIEAHGQTGRLVGKDGVLGELAA